MTHPSEMSDLDMMKNPGLWPQWPVLPVKRYRERGQMPDCAVLIDAGEPQPTVFQINPYDIPAGDLRENIINNPKVKHTKYDTLEALMADGWMVD